MSKPGSKVKLFDSDRRDLHRLSILLEHHHNIVLHTQAAIESLLARYGVNLNDGHWELDLDKGLLTHADPKEQQPH
jgi:hypothetical protein